VKLYTVRISQRIDKMALMPLQALFACNYAQFFKCTTSTITSPSESILRQCFAPAVLGFIENGMRFLPLEHCQHALQFAGTGGDDCHLPQAAEIHKQRLIRQKVDIHKGSVQLVV
jgi:hypothetical protein